MSDWKDKRIEAINRICEKKNLTCSPDSPYFDEVIDNFNSDAESLQDFKLERIKKDEKNNLLKVTIQIYYYLITQYFFVWFWVHNQGTLGMKTWKIKIICNNNNRMSYKQAIIRFNVAVLSQPTVFVPTQVYVPDKRYV